MVTKGKYQTRLNTQTTWPFARFSIVDTTGETNGDRFVGCTDTGEKADQIANALNANTNDKERVMLYMVVPKGAVDGESIRNSDHFPRLTDAPANATPQQIMETIFPNFSPRPNKQYYIVPMHDAMLVTFKPVRPQYDTVIEWVGGNVG